MSYSAESSILTGISPATKGGPRGRVRLGNLLEAEPEIFLM